jgi:hypothetical protein
LRCWNHQRVVEGDERDGFSVEARLVEACTCAVIDTERWLSRRFLTAANRDRGKHDQD